MDRSALLASYRAGHGLAREFYCDATVFAGDLDLLRGRWSYAAHVSELPHRGDYVLAELGPDGAIVIRGADGEVRALANVCRHRGSRLCDAARGRLAALVCPYHSWSYHLDGRLRAARHMPADFDPAAHGLARLPVAIIGGLIFVSHAQDPVALDAAAAALARMTDAHGWADAKIAARRRYAMRANWKLTLENYHECYHCAPAHPEFTALHALARPGARRIADGDVESWEAVADGQEVYRVMRSALAEGIATGGRDGRGLAPLMGGRRYDGDCVFAELGFLSAFLAYPDHGVIYRFLPRETGETEMEVIWIVRADAEAGRDYDEAELTWLWEVTSTADKTIIERNQAGILSHAYRPGPFSLMEPATRQFVERYVAEVRRQEQ